jgi:hypothetical protein
MFLILDGANGCANLGSQLGRYVGEFVHDAGMNNSLLEHLFIRCSAYLEVAVQADVPAAELLCHGSLLVGVKTAGSF